VEENVMKTHYWLGLVVTMVFSTAGLATQGNAGGATEERWSLNDSWLTAKTKFALWADARVKAKQIHVETTQGSVMLRGTVDSEEARGASEEIAKGVSGVKDVQNNLEVAVGPVRQTSDVQDDVITASIKDHIMKDLDQRLKQANIGVRTNDGVVGLTGEVSDLSTSEHASWTAWKTPGVKDVKNQLTVKKTI
jgi:hyperosmotically inducible periplasmic protein